MGGLAVRKIMEYVPDFEDAVQQIYAVNYMAPQYFIMSGPGPYEGVVLTIDRGGVHDENTPPIQTISNNASGLWHLVQTNDDLLHKPQDSRRSTANWVLASAKQEAVSTDSVLEFMHTVPIYNPLTVFTWVAVPATGFYKTVLPSLEDVHIPIGQFGAQPVINSSKSMFDQFSLQERRGLKLQRTRLKLHRSVHGH